MPAPIPFKVTPLASTTSATKVQLYDAFGNPISSTNGALNVNVGNFPAIQAENITQLGGTAIDTNSGNKSAGTQRIVLATDQPALTTPLPSQGYILASGDIVNPARVPTKLSASGPFGTTASPVTLVTAPVGQRYYLAAIKFDVDPTIVFASAILVVVSDSVDGTLAQWVVRPPTSLTATTTPVILTYNSPPGFFYKPSATASTLSCAVNSALGAGYLYMTVTYGLTSL